jgi:hypothetical protein
MSKRFRFALVFAVLALCLWALLLGTKVGGAPLMTASSSVKVTNLRDTAFTVSWTTDGVFTGTVEYGTTPALGSVAQDDRGAATSDDTHHVTLLGLISGTTYYFDVLSGDQRDDNNGAHYALTTGSVLELPTSDTVYGRAFQCDGTTPAQGTIVYVTLADGDGTGSLGQSAQMSGLVDENGWWHANLGNARVGRLSAHFFYSASGDQLVLEAQGAGDGIGDLAVDTGDDAPAADLVICPAANTAPALAWLPDQVFDQSTGLTGTIDVWAYAWDAESATSELTYTIEGPPPAGAGVWLEGNRYVHVDPSPNWCGGTDVTVRTTDPGGLWDEDTFRVAVSWSCTG